MQKGGRPVAKKRIAGITIELDGKTDKLENALKKVNAEIRNTQTQLKDVDRLLKLDPGNTELLRQKYEGLSSSIEATEGKLKTLREAERQMQDAGQDNGDKWDNLQREIIETEQKVKSLRGEMEKFGSVSAQQIAVAGEKVKSVGEKITGVGKAIMPASAAVIGLGTAAAAKFADVDKTMQLVNATMGNTEAQAAALEKAMEKAAANSTFGMSDAANAALNFARAGLTAEQAAAALAPSLNLAAGEGGNLDTVSAGLVATINGFHDSFKKTGYYADVFAAACNNSALDVNSLSNAMSVAAPIFATAGYSVADAALYLGTMADKGIDANKAANSLKTGLARLVSPAKAGAEAMEALHISVTNSDGSMKDSITVQRELHEAFARLSESEQIAAASAIFGKNQMAPWLALINTAPGDVDSLSASLANCKGTTDEMAEAMMNGFGGSIERLKSSLDVLMTSLGRLLADLLLPIIQGIQNAVDWLNSLDEGTRRMVVTIGVLVAAAGPVLIFLGNLTSAVGSIMTLAPQIVAGIGKLQTLLGTLGGGISGLWSLLMAHPFALVIAGITALVAAFLHFWNTSEEFRQFWIDLGATIVVTWEKAVSGVTTAWNNLKTGAAEAWENIKNTVHDAIERIKSFFDFQWELPKIKLPHFSIVGEFSLMPPQVPHIGVEWYRKAMDSGMILTSPTILPAANGSLRGFGDAGPEAVVGVDSLRSMISDAVTSANAAGRPRQLTVIFEANRTQLGRCVYDLYNEENQRVGMRYTE